MISPRMAKILGYLPKGILKAMASKMLNGYIEKYATIHIEGEENLNNIKTPTIFICNHLSNSDGLVMNKVLKKYDPTYVAGIKLSKDPVTNLGRDVIKNTLIKPNSPDKEGLKNIINLLNSGESVFIFPEGTRSRSGSMIEAKKGILLIAKLSKAPIVPIGLWGTENLMPINQGGDMSSEKFYEADVYVNFGKQIELPKREKGEDKKDYEERILNYLMYSISELIPEKYRGVYSEK